MRERERHMHIKQISQDGDQRDLRVKQNSFRLDNHKGFTVTISFRYRLRIKRTMMMHQTTIFFKKILIWI